MPTHTTPDLTHLRPRSPNSRWVLGSAVGGTTVIAGGAFWLSYTSLSDLARRSGISGGLAWVWPLIVDGMIVVATISVVALSGRPAGEGRQPRGSGYAWALLAGGACVSVAGNVTHATLASTSVEVPVPVAALVACVPPLVLLAVTHLTVLLARQQPPKTARRVRGALSRPSPTVASLSTGATPVALPPGLSAGGRAAVSDRMTDRPGGGVAVGLVSPRPRSRAATGAREEAARLRAGGANDSEIARQVGVHRSTVSRWLHADSEQTGPQMGQMVGRQDGQQCGDASRAGRGHGWEDKAGGTDRKDEDERPRAATPSPGR